MDGGNLYEKLLNIQKTVDRVIKDGKNTSDNNNKYDFASDENVLEQFRPMMDEQGLLLIPNIGTVELHEGATRSGTTRYMTEMNITMVWLDVESGEKLEVPWYAQGVDLAGEKGVGKALTYAEKYFLLKFFHVPTKKDDPDSDGRTDSGEKRQRGTQAAKENELYYRKAIPQMLSEIYDGDSEKIRAVLISLTKSDARGFPGKDSVDDLSPASLPVLYGKAKKTYEKKFGREFALKEEEQAEGTDACQV